MRSLPFIALILLLVTLPVVAQDSSGVERADQASKTLRGQQANGLGASWVGRQDHAGEMIDVQLTNTSGQPLPVEFVPGMVFEPSNPQNQRLIIESQASLTIGAGQASQVTLRSYCLDQRLDPPTPGQNLDGNIAADSTKYDDKIRILLAGLKLAREGKLTPTSNPLRHRTVVIQRALWMSDLGSGSSYTREDLLEEMKKEQMADRLSGVGTPGQGPLAPATTNSPSGLGSGQGVAIRPPGNLDRLAEAIWNDIQAVLAEARR